MRVVYAVISLAYLVTIYALPANRDIEEVEIIPLENKNGGQPVIATGIIGDPWSSPFDGLFESLAAMMARMRQQMDYLLRRVPSGNSTVQDSGFGFPQISGIDLGKGNTTSVTKVIDGHKVVINETEYRDEGDFGGAFFKVRIIDVQPDSSELTTEKDAENVPSKDAESVENSYENEIPKNKEIEAYKNLESFDEVDSSHQQFDQLSSIEDNSIESAAYPPRDLNRDIYVNQLMADAGAPTNPDAEVFFVPFEQNIRPR